MTMMDGTGEKLKLFNFMPSNNFGCRNFVLFDDDGDGSDCEDDITMMREKVMIVIEVD